MQLVVDTCVGRAAGPSSSLQAKAAVSILEAIRISGHTIVLSDDIVWEWTKANTKFALIWLTSMISSGRSRQCELSTTASRIRLRTNVRSSARNEAENAAMCKDLHLIEAAIESDMRIVSFDDTALNLFAKAARLDCIIGKIYWVAHSSHVSEIPIWLSQGAPNDSRFLLGT